MCNWPVLLILGFLAQLALIYFVTQVGLKELEATDQRLRAITDEHGQKMELTKIMQANARERTISLARMINLQDMFEHDAEQQRFHSYASSFMDARRKLLSLPLSAQEQSLLEKQWRRTLQAIPYQNLVIDLSLAHQTSAAQIVLTRNAIPAQDAVLQTLSELDDIARASTQQALLQASEAHRTARKWMILLSTLALLLGLMIASLVVRLMYRIGQERERLATHDVLTGLPNRTLLLDRLEQAILRSKRQGTQVGLLFLDLDGFKQVNDTLGHATGDELLKKIAGRLKGVVRANDIVSRLGGDEFIIGLTDAGTRKQIEQVAEKLIATVSRPMELAGREVSVSGSVGVCLYPDDAMDAKGLLRCADFAMYAAKQSGKNRFHHYSSELALSHAG